MRFQFDLEQQVAAAATAGPPATLAGKTDFLAGQNPRRNINVVMLFMSGGVSFRRRVAGLQGDGFRPSPECLFQGNPQNGLVIAPPAVDGIPP